MIDVSRYQALGQIQKQIAAFNDCKSFASLDRQNQKTARLIDTARLQNQIQPASFFSYVCLAKSAYNRRRSELNKSIGGA